MGQLCDAIDQMAEAVAVRERAIERSAREQIGQSEKLASIGRLAAGTAHEINNPLTGVLTFAHLLRKNENLGERERQDIEVIIRETTRVREIVRGLLDFARQSPSERQRLDLNGVVSHATALLRGQKEFRHISIKEQPADDLPKVLGDRNQLEQVVLNLSLNGCEAMPDGGTLTISTRVDGDSVVLTVSDTGTGIPEEDRGRIFDPFFTTKPVGRGTGLGLSVTYGIVQQHGGSVEVTSKVGKGSMFTIRLPAQPKESASSDEG
jgi:two-component system NtrC family sensor kinase